MVICLEQGADLHMAQLMPLPFTVSCFTKIQIGFSFLVSAHPGSPGQRAVKWACVWNIKPESVNQLSEADSHSDCVLSGGDPDAELVRHFLIETTSKGVRLKGCNSEPTFGDHALMPLSRQFTCYEHHPGLE